MKKLKQNESGFSAVEILLVVLIVAVIGFGGYYVYSRNKSTSNNSTTVSSSPSTSTKTTTLPSQQTQLKSYTIKNEGLTFSYNPKTTTIETKKPSQQNDLFVENVNVKTGKITLSITAGISGIGGGPGCMVADRDKCEVVDTFKSTFLNKPITYRLIKAIQATECGYDGVPACDVVPLTTSFFLDTSKATDSYGPCCGTINSQARNTGKKAKYAGDLLVSILPAKQIQNKDLLTNKDFLDTIKIIESMHY